MAGQRVHTTCLVQVHGFTEVYIFCLRCFYFLWFSMLFFFCFVLFFPSAGRYDRPLYCTVPCNEAWQFDVWMMCLDCGFKCLGFFFSFQSCQAVRRARTREHWCELLIGIHAVKTGFVLNLSTRESNERNVCTEFLVTYWSLWFSVSLGFKFDHDLYVWRFYVVK